MEVKIGLVAVLCATSLGVRIMLLWPQPHVALCGLPHDAWAVTCATALCMLLTRPAAALVTMLALTVVVVDFGLRTSAGVRLHLGVLLAVAEQLLGQTQTSDDERSEMRLGWRERWSLLLKNAAMLPPGTLWMLGALVPAAAVVLWASRWRVPLTHRHVAFAAVAACAALLTDSPCCSASQTCGSHMADAQSANALPILVTDVWHQLHASAAERDAVQEGGGLARLALGLGEGGSRRQQSPPPRRERRAERHPHSAMPKAHWNSTRARLHVDFGADCSVVGVYHAPSGSPQEALWRQLCSCRPLTQRPIAVVWSGEVRMFASRLLRASAHEALSAFAGAQSAVHVFNLGHGPCSGTRCESGTSNGYSSKGQWASISDAQVVERLRGICMGSLYYGRLPDAGDPGFRRTCPGAVLAAQHYRHTFAYLQLKAVEERLWKRTSGQLLQQQFAWVVRLRPDVYFLTPLAHHTFCTRMTMYVPYGATDHMNDHVAIMSRDAASVAMNFFDAMECDDIEGQVAWANYTARRTLPGGDAASAPAPASTADPDPDPDPANPHPHPHPTPIPPPSHPYINTTHRCR